MWTTVEMPFSDAFPSAGVENVLASEEIWQRLLKEKYIYR